MSETNSRIISAIIAIPIVLVFIFWDNMWVDGAFYFVALSFLIKELNGFFDFLTVTDQWFSTTFVIVGGGLQLFLLHKGDVNGKAGYGDEALTGFLLLSIFTFFLLHLFQNNFKGMIQRLQVVFFNVFFSLFAVFFFFKLKYFYGVQGVSTMGILSDVNNAVGLGELDNYILLYVFLTAWCYDSFAYLGGKTFGNKTLGLAVSPNKTWMGLLFGVVFSSLSFVVVATLVKNQFPLLFEKTFFSNWTVGVFVTMGLALVSQFGDLMASFIKRSVGVKNSGVFLKGHGGFIDRIDSLIPATFAFYYYLKYLG